MHVHPGAEELGRVYQADVPILSGMEQFAAAVRDLRVEPQLGGLVRRGARRLRGVAAHEPDAGPRRPRRVPRPPARTRARRDRHERRGQPHGLGASVLAVPRLSRASSRRRAARWATACRLPSPPRSSRPERTVDLLLGRRRLPHVGPGARDGGAVRVADRRSSSSTTGCTARSACTRSGTFPGRVVGTDLVNPDFAAFARAFGAHGETVERDGASSPARSSARSTRAFRR